jgi:hypothetical protein
MPSIFVAADVEALEARIDALKPDSPRLWGTMDAARMLAHVNVAYEMAYEPAKHPKPNALVKFLLKVFVKQSVVGDKPYKHNGQTAPAFVIADERDFEAEKARTKGYLRRVLSEGEAAFEGRESLSFGTLTAREWNNLFHKHLDHHLAQFGA